MNPLSLRVTAAAWSLVFCLPAQSAPPATTATPPQWSQFRGAGSQGVASEDVPLPERLDRKKNLLWDCPLPPGHSSPCLFGDRIFLTARPAGARVETICIDRERGAVLWRQGIEIVAEARMHRVNSPASPTPVADDQRVYSYFGSFGLVCYDHKGKECWRKPIRPGNNTFGTGSSPILDGELLFLNRDTNGASFLLAIDRRTGKTVWTIDRTGFPSGWSTPVVRRRRGTAELLVYGAFQLTAYDLKDGSERWSVPGLADEPCITPVLGDELVYVSSYNMRTNPEVIGLPDFDRLLTDYDENRDKKLSRAEVQANKSILSRGDADGEGDHPLRGFFRFLDRDKDGQLDRTEWQGAFTWLAGFKHANALIAIRPGDGDKVQAKIAWQHGRGVPECPSPLLYRNRIYLVKNGGLATCLDAATGVPKFHGRIGSRGPCYASPVAGDGKIFTASARGVVTVLAAEDRLRVLSRNDLGERIMATPALVDGRVFVRTEKRLLAFGRKR